MNMSDPSAEDNYPLTYDDLLPGKRYEDSRGNWRVLNQENELVVIPRGVASGETLPEHLPYDKRDVRYRELEEREFASVQPSKKEA
jgi:hypothetical protein